MPINDESKVETVWLNKKEEYPLNMVFFFLINYAGDGTWTHTYMHTQDP